MRAGEGGVGEVLRPDPDGDRAVEVPAQSGAACQDRLRHGQPLVAEQQCQAGTVGPQYALHEVHRGGADEPGDEQVRRPVVELLRRGDLLQHALLHDRDAAAERHRLGLVVRDVDGRHAHLPGGPGDLRPHLHP